MDKQIQKLKQYLERYLGKTKAQIYSEYGKPETISDNNIWFYDRKKIFFFKDEICFFFTDDKVADITVTEYVFGIPLHNIFYNKGQVPEYIISPVKYVL
ncbi:hypothetical protein [Chryseobacterium sp. RR2-3-20]|uniref:hypothetical protein n=1 Tax=Chryseobacterium sp. RR2-3-20 TaxID=2787626 RepID=UPI001ADF77B3|nr:hypothetical protein [Chryseobacterium sp. RR2-3-20]